MTTPPGRHSDEAAEERGEWLRWHNGSDVGSTPGFRQGGKSAAEPRRIIQLGGAGGKAPGEPGQPGKRARIENGRLIIEDDGGGAGGKGAEPDKEV